MRFFISGTAGFIGFHLARRLLDDGHRVFGFDAMTPYYDVELKRRRHRILRRHSSFTAVEAKLEDIDALVQAVEDAQPEAMIHLAAQAGVRYSLENPRAYVDANLIGSFNILEVARLVRPAHLLLASTSSAYGANLQMPFAEADKADHAITLYAATKKAMEGMSHAYAHLWDIPTTCFRFFTVYGPWGRPDMALFKFVDAIEAGRAIEIYGHGQMKRDFTYVDDLVEGIVRLVSHVPQRGRPLHATHIVDTLSPVAPWRVVNIAGGRPVDLLAFVEVVERCLGTTANKTMLPMQPGDVPATFADHRLLQALTGFRPSTSIEQGVEAFVNWYRAYKCNADSFDAMPLPL